jgi:hypothetical protein
MLQFIIELDQAGYAEASNPRTDLTLEEKLSALRLHNSRQRSHTITRTDRLELSLDGFSVDHETLTSNWSMLLKDGVLARWSSVLPSSYMPLQLDLVQLPSLNTGLDLRQWRLVQHDMNIRHFDMDPVTDLLLLLEYTGKAPQLMQPVPVDNNDRYKFHFRTLSTNNVHPAAVVETLDCELRTGDTWGFGVQCLGDVIVAYLPFEDAGSTHIEHKKTGLLMYNWTNGALLVSKFGLLQEKVVLHKSRI